MLFAGGKAAGRRDRRSRKRSNRCGRRSSPSPARSSGFGLGFVVERARGPAPRRPRRRDLRLRHRAGRAARRQARRGRRRLARLRQRRHRRTSPTTALQQMLAVKQGKPLPTIEETAPLKPEDARKLAGPLQGRRQDHRPDRTQTAGCSSARRGRLPRRAAALGDDLMVDDRLGFGPKFEARRRQAEGRRRRLRASGRRRSRRAAPAKWAGLIGEYGWDHNTLFILEKDGKLHALIEWFFLYPLEEE